MNEIIKRADVVGSLDDLQRVAKLLAASGYFEAKGNGEQAIAQLATKVLAGREMGFSPFASVNGIHIIQGKPTVSAQLMAAAVKGSAKYDYRIRKMDDSACQIEFFERTPKGLDSLGVSTFTAEDAKRAGTQNMAKFARNMLFARAMSNGVRWYCPDVFASGIYTPEEMGATVDGEGEIVEARTVDVRTGEIVEDVQFQEDSDAAPAGETLLRTMHAIGHDLYGDGWDDKRHELVRRLTKGRTASSKELTNGEAMRMVEGMGEKLRANQAAQPALVDTPQQGNGYN